jgi:hypothetical protein
MKARDRMPIHVDECCGFASASLTRRRLLKGGLLATVLSGTTMLEGSHSVAHARKPEDDPCASLMPAATGGPATDKNDVISLRWLGTACFELVHRGRVYLLDAFYDDRGPRVRPIGITAEQVVQADAIFIGHAHYDHIADAASIAVRTGARVIGDEFVSAPLLLSQGVRADQIRGVNGLGGERLHFDGFTVEPILAHHSVAVAGRNAEGESLYQEIIDAYFAVMPGLTDEEVVDLLAEIARGSGDPRIVDQGTIAYLFTFEKGYRLLWLDSAGPITSQLETVMRRVGSTNMAVVGYAGSFPRFQIPVTLPLVELFNPDLFLPAHHDEFQVADKGVVPDMATEPLFTAIRDAMPKTRCASPLYRTPVCINIKSGEFTIGPR